MLPSEHLKMPCLNKSGLQITIFLSRYQQLRNLHKSWWGIIGNASIALVSYAGRIIASLCQTDVTYTQISENSEHNGYSLQIIGIWMPLDSRLLIYHSFCFSRLKTRWPFFIFIIHKPQAILNLLSFLHLCPSRSDLLWWNYSDKHYFISRYSSESHISDGRTCDDKWDVR